MTDPGDDTPPDLPPPAEAPRPERRQALARLDRVCHEIARGNYGNTDDLFALTVDPDASQTIRELAESFGSMLVQVEAREFRLNGLIDDLREAQRQLEEANRQLARENVTLTQKVQTLTIEIDRQRFKREVGEIVESDYFQDLQKRARTMRARVKGVGGAQDEPKGEAGNSDARTSDASSSDAPNDPTPNGEPQDGQS